MRTARSARVGNSSPTIPRCKCGNGPADCQLVYYKPTNRGMSLYHDGWYDMRCADKAAFAILSRGVDFVKVMRRS